MTKRSEIPTKQSMNARAGVFKQFVESLTTLSKCTDKHVAAIITDDTFTQIYSIGINGGPKGGIDCLCALGVKYTCVHAEINAIAKCPVSCVGKVMICSYSPCVTCAATIVNSGITTLIYIEEYKENAGIRILEDSGVTVYKI